MNISIRTAGAGEKHECQTARCPLLAAYRVRVQSGDTLQTHVVWACKYHSTKAVSQWLNNPEAIFQNPQK